MVRTPLARRINENDHLNSAYVTLPCHKEVGVNAIMNRLNATGNEDRLDLAGHLRWATRSRSRGSARRSPTALFPTWRFQSCSLLSHRASSSGRRDSSAAHEGAERGDVEVDREGRDLAVLHSPYLGIVLVQMLAFRVDVVIADDPRRGGALDDQLLELDPVNAAQERREGLPEGVTAARLQPTACVGKDDVMRSCQLSSRRASPS